MQSAAITPAEAVNLFISFNKNGRGSVSSVIAVDKLLSDSDSFTTTGAGFCDWIFIEGANLRTGGATSFAFPNPINKPREPCIIGAFMKSTVVKNILH